MIISLLALGTAIALAIRSVVEIPLLLKADFVHRLSFMFPLGTLDISD